MFLLEDSLLVAELDVELSHVLLLQEEALVGAMEGRTRALKLCVQVPLIDDRILLRKAYGLAVALQERWRALLLLLHHSPCLSVLDLLPLDLQLKLFHLV